MLLSLGNSIDSAVEHLNKAVLALVLAAIRKIWRLIGHQSDWNSARAVWLGELWESD